VNARQFAVKARAILGEKAGYRVDNGALTGDERDAALDAARQQRDHAKALAEARDARAAELLAADERFQQLKAEAHGAAVERDRLQGLAHRRRVTVGCVGALFFSVRAEADNFADAIEKLQGRAS